MSWIKCLKIKYSKREAQTALNKVLHGRRGKERKEVRYYHCPYCNFWHLTSKYFEPFGGDPPPPLSLEEKEKLNTLKEKFGELIN